MGDTVIAIIAIVGFCLSFIGFCCKAYTKNKAPEENSTRRRQRVQRTGPSQQEDIYNISSRVQGQGQGQWPTHDAHVSLDNFTITNEINKYNDDPPTYEEAMNLAASNNNNLVPAAVPKTATSTSTSAAN